MSTFKVYLPGRTNPIACDGDSITHDCDDTIIIKRQKEDTDKEIVAIISRAGAVFVNDLQKNSTDEEMPEYMKDIQTFCEKNRNLMHPLKFPVIWSCDPEVFGKFLIWTDNINPPKKISIEKAGNTD